MRKLTFKDGIVFMEETQTNGREIRQSISD